jgi:hypothetical protein
MPAAEVPESDGQDDMEMSNQELNTNGHKDEEPAEAGSEGNQVEQQPI